MMQKKKFMKEPIREQKGGWARGHKKRKTEKKGY